MPQIAFSPALNYAFGNPVAGFQTSPSWTQFLNTTAPFFSPGSVTTLPSGVAAASAGLKFFGECVTDLGLSKILYEGFHPIILNLQALATSGCNWEPVRVTEKSPTRKTFLLPGSGSQGIRTYQTSSSRKQISCQSQWPEGAKLCCRCKQNLLTLQATCSFVFDYSTRRLLDLLSKASPAGGIPLGGTVTFQFCTLGLGNSQVQCCAPTAPSGHVHACELHLGYSPQFLKFITKHRWVDQKLAGNMRSKLNSSRCSMHGSALEDKHGCACCQ